MGAGGSFDSCMKVRFKNNTEPCIQYHVKNEVPVIGYDEVLNKYCPCIELEILGLVASELVTEAFHSDNTNATDLAIYLTNN